MQVCVALRMSHTSGLWHRHLTQALSMRQVDQLYWCSSLQKIDKLFFSEYQHNDSLCVRISEKYLKKYNYLSQSVMVFHISKDRQNHKYLFTWRPTKRFWLYVSGTSKESLKNYNVLSWSAGAGTLWSFESGWSNNDGGKPQRGPVLGNRVPSQVDQSRQTTVHSRSSIRALHNI